MFVGASGGGDSTALLVLLAPIARGQGRRLIAGIVDHGLRDGSAEDAARAARIVEALGAEVRTVRLDGLKPNQASARAARYATLARIAREIGADTLFLGHTRDDQAETVLMRADAGSGARGLAGMAPLSPCPIWPEGRDLQFARPLLDWRRSALRDVLRGEGVPWLEDPANSAPRFARVRARARLAVSGETDALAALSAARAREAAGVDRLALEFLKSHASVHDDEVSLALVTAEADCIRALSVVAAAVGGATRAPAPDAARRLAARLMAGQDGTLAGARFRTGAMVRATRDPGGVLGRRGGGRAAPDLPLPARETVVWDGRLALTAHEGGAVAVAPDRHGGALLPSIRRGGVVSPLETSPGIGAHWVVAARIERLLWRAGPPLGA